MERATAEASSTVLVKILGWHRAMELSGIRLDLLAQTRFLFFSVGLSSSQMDQLHCV